MKEGRKKAGAWKERGLRKRYNGHEKKRKQGEKWTKEGREEGREEGRKEGRK
jgi:hypothetical protein